ncbi:uncharacterized protein [Littorina saxatilis]|uniref:uncharacterized protein n=1 Tax=Littorina saxatilis TaxID=31220 RepID=UPI0038B48CE4
MAIFPRLLFIFPQGQKGGKTSELENSLLQTLTAHVHSCLTLASANRFESIIFPSLGTGNLKYPPHRVAQTMFSAIEDFFKEMPKSSLKDVYICCHEKDIKVIQAFWSEDITRTFGVCTPWHTAVGGANSQGARVSVEVQGGFLSYHSSVSLVHIVEADALACSYPKVDLLICSNSQKPEIWKRFQAHQTFCGVADSKQKEPRHEVKTALLKARNMETVLIFLDTFEFRSLGGKIAASHAVSSVVLPPAAGDGRSLASCRPRLPVAGLQLRLLPPWGAWTEVLLAEAGSDFAGVFALPRTP